MSKVVKLRSNVVKFALCALQSGIDLINLFQRSLELSVKTVNFCFACYIYIDILLNRRSFNFHFICHYLTSLGINFYVLCMCSPSPIKVCLHFVFFVIFNPSLHIL